MILSRNLNGLGFAPGGNDVSNLLVFFFVVNSQNTIQLVSHVTCYLNMKEVKLHIEPIYCTCIYLGISLAYLCFTYVLLKLNIVCFLNSIFKKCYCVVLCTFSVGFLVLKF